jgi:hypothetical protein
MSKAVLGGMVKQWSKGRGTISSFGRFLGGGLVDPFQEFLVQRAEGEVNTF